MSINQVEKQSDIYQGCSQLHQIVIQTQSYVKLLIKRIGEIEKGYENQLQKLQQRLRKQTKNQCEMKIYCEHLQDELRNEKDGRKKWQKQLNQLTVQYHKQIETLKTQLSNAMIIKTIQQRPLSTGRDSIKPKDTVSKIKMRLFNLGNIQLSQPTSCLNTLRNPTPEESQSSRPISQPTSLHSSPVHSQQKNKSIKDQKKNINSKINNKSKGKVLTKNELIKQKSSSQSKLKSFKKK